MSFILISMGIILILGFFIDLYHGSNFNGFSTGFL
jgi:hypothetical protein